MLISVSVVRQKEVLQAYSEVLQKNLGSRDPGEVSGRPRCSERGQLRAAAQGFVPLEVSVAPGVELSQPVPGRLKLQQ